MDADENGIARLIGNMGAKLEREENVVLARHDDLESSGLKERPQLPRNIEGVILLVAVATQRAFIKTAVARIKHDRLDFAIVLNHVRPQLRLDCLCEIDPRDQKFPVLGYNGKAEPVPHTVHDRFAAVEGELELVTTVVEHKGFASRINIPQKAVKLRDVIGA